MTEEKHKQEILLRIEHVAPLTGTAVADNGNSHSFEGWLEMMSTIAGLIDSDAAIQP